MSDSVLQPDLLERVLSRLGLTRRSEPTLEGLRTLYGAWSRHVPFDNVRKLIHVQSGNNGPLPGSTAEDFLEAWLKYGTGGTCWSNAGASYALLKSLGFNAERGIATMLVAPNIPPNHGTVQVTFGDARYLVDTSMLYFEPLPLKIECETRIEHPAWGVRCTHKEGRFHVAWRPLHKVDGFECRLESFGADGGAFQTLYGQTRGWSPFNYEVTARKNRGNTVVGMAFGHAIKLLADGTVSREPATYEARAKILIEDIGISEELVSQLPQDTPTPPPPWSKTAAALAQ